MDSAAAAKVPGDAVHGDAVIGFRDGGEKSDDAEMLLLEQGVERHGAVFAALQQKRMGPSSSRKSPTVVDFAKDGAQHPAPYIEGSIAASEAIVEAETKIAAQRGEA